MSNYGFAALVGVAMCSAALATGIVDHPVDVEDFIDRREMCDHFRGEEPYDADRAAFLAEKIQETCAGTDRELRYLKDKYRDDENTLEILGRFEEQIETAGRTQSDQQLLAPWEIHTIVTDGRTTYEGRRIRAVLTYGEIGNPEINVEMIDVEMGYPDASRVLWQIPIDITGGLPDPCPLAESYCADVQNMRWAFGALIYKLVGPDSSFSCKVSGAQRGAPKTRCDAAQ